MFEDLKYWLEYKKDNLTCYFRGAAYGIMDVIDRVRWEADMLMPRIQDYADSSETLSSAARTAKRNIDTAQATYETMAWKAGNAFKPAISDVAPEDSPEFIKDRQAKDRRKAMADAEDAVIVDGEIVEDDVKLLDYRP